MTIEEFRALVQRMIHAQTCEVRTHRRGTQTQCRVPLAEAERLLRAARSVPR